MFQHAAFTSTKPCLYKSKINYRISQELTSWNAAETGHNVISRLIPLKALKSGLRDSFIYTLGIADKKTPPHATTPTNLLLLRVQVKKPENPLILIYGHLALSLKN